jgi:hypothetical protein
MQSKVWSETGGAERDGAPTRQRRDAAGFRTRAFAGSGLASKARPLRYWAIPLLRMAGRWRTRARRRICT